MKALRCGECGSKEIEKRNQKGKDFPWKDYPSVFLSKDYEVLQCKICRNLILSDSDVKRLNEVILKTIIEDTKYFIEVILSRENCKQSELATHLGVSQEYLSEIKSGRKQPGFQTYNFLKTLAVEQRSFVVSDPKFDRFRRISA